MKLAAIFALALLLAACGRGGADGRTAATGEWAADSSEDWMQPAVEVVTLERGRLVDTVESSGLVAGAREVRIVGETQGVVREIGFELGERVRRDQVLVRFDDALESSAMRQAREEQEIARLDLAAIERLTERGSASRVELARARAAAEGAAARYERARREYLSRTVRAPFDGVVASRPADLEVGSYLNIGAKIARVIDLDRARVDLSLGEGEIALVSVGAPAEVVIGACPEPIRGARVTAIAAGADAATGSYSVRIVWDNECGANLRAGMSALVRIRTDNGAEGVVLPSAALMSRQGELSVFVVDEDDTVHRRVVRIGERFADRVIVVEGLEPGERIVVSGTTRLRDGNRVRPTTVGFGGAS